MAAADKTDWARLHNRYPPGNGKDLKLPDDWKRAEYPSAADDSNQGAWFYRPGQANGPVPLLVILHPWSSRPTNEARSPWWQRTCSR